MSSIKTDFENYFLKDWTLEFSTTNPYLIMDVLQWVGPSPLNVALIHEVSGEDPSSRCLSRVHLNTLRAMLM